MIHLHLTDLIRRTQETIALVKGQNCLVEFLVLPDDADENFQKINSKVDRALERTRRAAIAMLDSSETKSPDDCRETVQALLETLVDAFEASLRQVSLSPLSPFLFSPSLPTQKPHKDILTRCLDTLFVLGRTVLNPADPRTYVPAHDHLTRATSLLGIPVPDAANYTRCVSGAFHNLGVIMYQAGRHGTAIGFLKEACTLGVQALGMRKKKPIEDEKGDDRKDKAEEGWCQLEEYLYRRWELLAVCYSKIGDRKVGVMSILWSISAYSFRMLLASIRSFR